MIENNTREMTVMLIGSKGPSTLIIVGIFYNRRCTNLKQPLKILIADDSKIDREMLSKHLLAWGYQVYQAKNGKEVIETVGMVRPDLVILDGIMPEMDGYAVCEYLREHDTKTRTPVILITAYDKPEAVARAFAAGAEEYLTKPLYWDVLKYKLRRIFRTRNAEIALRKSEEKLQGIFHNVVAGISMLDEHGNCIYANQKMADLLGYSIDELYEITLRDTTPDEDWALTQERIGKMLTHEIKEYHVEKRYVRKDKTIFWGRLSASVVYNSANQIEYIIGVVVDITQFKNETEKLQASEERFRSFVENFPGIIYVKDKHSRTLFLSKQFAGMLHEQVESVLGKGNNDLFPPELASSMTTVDQEVLELQSGDYKLVEECFLDKGEKKWYDSYKFPILRQNEEPLIGGLKVESTERKRMDAQLQLQNKYLLALNQVTVHLLNRLDLDEVLAMVIQHATELFGKASGSLYLLQENGVDVELKYAVGREEEYLGITHSKEEGLVGRVFATGKLFIVENYQEWAGRIASSSFQHLGMVIGLPLLSGTKVVGACVILNEDGWQFTEEEKILMTRFIGLISIAYDNALLYQQAQEEISERKIVEEKLRYMSMHDSLTGLYNRTYFAEEMQRIAAGQYSSIGIIVADVDGLKKINDTLGHACGDDLIITAAHFLQKSCRNSDVVARIGGDEFVIFLPEVEENIVGEICQRIKDPLACYLVPATGECLRLSIGWAVSSSQGTDIYEVFKEADANMYRDKLAGKSKG